MTTKQQYLILGLGLLIPLAVTLIPKKSQPKLQPNIKQILQECLIKISHHKKAVEHMLQLTEDKQPVLEPFEYVRQVGGKKIRLSVLLSQMFSEKLDYRVIKIGGLIEYLHTASLIVDDIQDGSILRRQKPCCHLVYGLDRSINAANLVYFLPFHRLLCQFEDSQSKSRLIQAFAQEMVTSHLGQAEDVLVHKLQRKQDLPSLQQYYRLISAKTSSLLRMMISMIGVVVKINQKNLQIFKRVMNYVGISFQITDDILNLSRGMGKGIIAEDLHEKKFTIIVHFLRDHDEFMQEFIHPKKSDQSIKRMLQIIQDKKVIPLCKQIAQQFSQKALTQLELIQSPFQKGKFIKLIQFIIKRDR